MAKYSKKEKEGIGGRVEAMRQSRGWSAEKLAELLDTTRSSVNMKERGERPFTLDEACSLCDIFDLTLDELVSGVKTKNVQARKELGLNDSAIDTLETFNMLYAKKDENEIPALNKVLSSIEALDALYSYMEYAPSLEGYYLEKYAGADNTIVTPAMSPEVYEVVLEQNLLRVLRLIKAGKAHPGYFSSKEEFLKLAKKRSDSHE